MLPRSLRLTRKGFEETQGLSRVTTSHFSISYKRVPEKGGLAVIISKKNIKSAVGRHFYKRRIRTIARPWVTPTIILILTARKGVETLSYAQMNDELSIALKDILAK
jgi:ribonuclease P protein component